MSETARWTGPAPPQQQQRSQQPSGQGDGANLADILERVLDKGIVIAGDIQVNLLDIELLTIKIRLVVASVDRAKEMGIDWWERDPTLSAGRRELEDENKELRARIEALERNGHRPPEGRELAPEADDEPEDVDEEPYDDVEEGEVVDEVEDVEDLDAEDDVDPDEGEADEPDGPPDDEPRTRGGRSGRATRAKAEPDEPPADDDPDDDPDDDGPARSRSGRGRGRASRGTAAADGEKREMPARRKPGSKRSSREG
jgi:hypothetical protein